MAPSGDLGSTIKVLELMAEVEKSIGELYRACAKVDRTNVDFWHNLEQQENNHAENIRQMITIVSRKKNLFQQGRPFNTFALETFKKGIVANLEKVQSGEIPRDRLLFIARDNERSILEQRYHELLKTGDVEYLTLVGGIMEETAKHQQQIESKIAGPGK